MRQLSIMACSLKRSTLIHKGLLFAVLLYLGGCASLASHGLTQGIASSIQNQSDLAIVERGMPAYLLMVDGMIMDTPHDATLLMAGSRLYSAYAAVFATDEAHARMHTEKAYRYAKQAVCKELSKLCSDEARDFGRFTELVDDVMGREGAELLYTYATAWASWIQLNSGEWTYLADLPRVEILLKRVIALDDDFEHGMPHVYLGVINAQLPPSLGGRPEIGREHFEHAIELSHGRNLIAKVEYARTYARLLFDRELHDRLLKEVLVADPNEEGLTLINVVAQKEAQILLDESGEYFEG